MYRRLQTNIASCLSCESFADCEFLFQNISPFRCIQVPDTTPEYAAAGTKKQSKGLVRHSAIPTLSYKPRRRETSIRIKAIRTSLSLHYKISIHRRYDVASLSDLQQNYGNDSWIAKRAVLPTQNERLQFLNNILGSRIPGNMRTFLSAYSVEEAEVNELNYFVELLNSLPGTASLPDHQLTLKKRETVTLQHNL